MPEARLFMEYAAQADRSPRPVASDYAVVRLARTQRAIREDLPRRPIQHEINDVFEHGEHDLGDRPVTLHPCVVRTTTGLLTVCLVVAHDQDGATRVFNHLALTSPSRTTAA